MLPALTTKPKQAVRQVQGLSNDSIDSYSNTPLTGGTNSSSSYVDRTVASPPSISKSSTGNSGRIVIMRKERAERVDSSDGSRLARVVRDRKASGEEDLALKTGDVVKVLSTKRTGYLKCEFGEAVGYIPSSYLEFFDDQTDDGVGENIEAPQSEKRKKKKKKEKQAKKDKGENEESEPEDTPRSPRRKSDDRDGAKVVEKTEGGGEESPRKSKKKHKRTPRAGKEEHEDGKNPTENGGDPSKPKSKRHSSRRKHRRHDEDQDSSSSSSNDNDKGEDSRRHHHHRSRSHRRHRHHRSRERDGSTSGSYSSSSDSSDVNYRRRRRRRHRRSSSEAEYSDTDKRRGKHSSRKHHHRDRANSGSMSDVESGVAHGNSTSRTKEKNSVKNVERGVAKLHTEDDKHYIRPSDAVSGNDDETMKKHAMTSYSNSSRESNNAHSQQQTTATKDARKDDESRAETTTSSSNSSSQKGSKSTFSKQIGDRMRSFLGGGKKNERSSKNSSGILNACPGTVQGEEGWYEHGENERYYFILVDGKWSLLYGPMTEDDFEVYSAKVMEQNRLIELPPTYLHKTGYFLTRDLRVQKV